MLEKSNYEEVFAPDTETSTDFPDTIISDPFPEINPDMLEEAYRIEERLSGHNPLVADAHTYFHSREAVETDPGTIHEILAQSPLADASIADLPPEPSWTAPAPVRQPTETSFWKRLQQKIGL